MLVIASLLGMLGGMVGAAASALFPKLPSGAMIVLACAGCFLISMIFGRTRGVLVRSLRRRRVNRLIARQHLLRAIFELHESTDTESFATVSLSELLPKRSWSPVELSRAVGLAEADELVTRLGDQVQLTKKGRVEAERRTREHRLWELYLITHADIAPSQVDREADRIEHVLEPEIVAELEALLTGDTRKLPQSPHQLSLHGFDVQDETEPSIHSGEEA
jgi:manganese/zinc/iron transport system permease protein